MKSNIDILNIDDCTLINFTQLPHSELENILKWRNHESIRRWMYNDKIISFKEHLQFVENLKNNSSDLYFLVKKDEAELGVIYFNQINQTHKRCLLGIYANPNNKRKSKGRILIGLIKKTAFDVLNLHTLRLEVMENNQKAIELYNQAGFEVEGTLRDYVFRDNRWYNVIIMSQINPKEKSI